MPTLSSKKGAPSRLLRLLVFALFLATAISCGGGGGGGSNATITYITDWTHRSRAVTGLSQRVQIFDIQGQLKKSLVVNQDFVGLQQTVIGDIGSGMRRVRIELFSQRDLGGIKTGILETLVNVNGNTTFRSTVGEDPTSILVTPANASFEVNHSQQFYAAGFASPGIATFLEPASVTWQTLGGTATVNATGLVFGTSEGPGTVRATDTNSGLLGSAVFTVEPLNTTTSKWTVMVFMNAANDLYPFSTLNMNQMEEVAGNPDVRFVVQWKQSQAVFPNSSFNGTRRYLARQDTSSSIVSELIQDLGADVDMGDPDELHNFIQWAKTNYPAERYVLVIWNHGFGPCRVVAHKGGVDFTLRLSRRAAYICRANRRAAPVL